MQKTIFRVITNTRARQNLKFFRLASKLHYHRGIPLHLLERTGSDLRTRGAGANISLGVNDRLFKNMKQSKR